MEKRHCFQVFQKGFIQEKPDISIADNFQTLNITSGKKEKYVDIKILFMQLFIHTARTGTPELACIAE